MLALLCLLLAAPPAAPPPAEPPYVVVLQDGGALLAAAPPRYADGVACVALAGGGSVEVRLAEVDEVATHMLNAAGVVDRALSTLEVMEQVLPQFPEELRGAGIAGIPVVEAIFGRDGKVETLRVLRSVHPLLDAAVTAAIRQWVIAPPGDRPERTRTVIFVHHEAG